MNNKNKKGFMQILSLISLLVVIAIMIAGYYWYESKSLKILQGEKEQIKEETKGAAENGLNPSGGAGSGVKNKALDLKNQLEQVDQERLNI